MSFLGKEILAAPIQVHTHAPKEMRKEWKISLPLLNGNMFNNLFTCSYNMLKLFTSSNLFCGQTIEMCTEQKQTIGVYNLLNFFLISFKYLQLEPTRQCIKSELNHWKIKYLTKRRRGKGSKSAKMRAKRCGKNLYKSRSEYTFHAIFVAFTPCAASSRKKKQSW